jgi:hypothetical protein
MLDGIINLWARCREPFGFFTWRLRAVFIGFVVAAGYPADPAVANLPHTVECLTIKFSLLANMQGGALGLTLTCSGFIN